MAIKYYDLLWVMTEKELKARYKNTLFGFLWVFINPVLQMLIIGFVFRFFTKEPVQNYYFYLLVGLLVWNFFSITLSKTTSSIVNERSLIKKAYFPREVIPMSIIFSNFVNMLAAFSVLLVPSVVFGLFSFTNTIRLALGMILLMLFTVGLSLLTSSLNTRYRDVSFFVQAILTVWFYATPIVYSINAIPKDLIWLWKFNPLTVIVQLFQNAFVSAPPPGIGIFFSNLIVALAVFFLGIYIFNKQSKDFDDWI